MRLMPARPRRREHRHAPQPTGRTDGPTAKQLGYLRELAITRAQRLMPCGTGWSRRPG